VIFFPFPLNAVCQKKRDVSFLFRAKSPPSFCRHLNSCQNGTIENLVSRDKENFLNRFISRQRISR
jgi:hypothetical protein